MDVGPEPVDEARLEELLADGAVVGAVRLTPVPDPADSATRPGEIRNSRVEVGIWLTRAARGPARLTSVRSRDPDDRRGGPR